MMALPDVPFNSIVWLMGASACFMLGYRSLASYRRSKNELSLYLTWFGLLMGTGQLFLAIPPFFTLDTDFLHKAYIVGEFWIYGSAVAQAAILWCLILRSRVPRYAVTLPIVIIGFASWLYAVPRSTLEITHDNFIIYRDPLLSTIIIGVVLISLFVPVGVYFLRSASKQAHLKAMLTSLSLGVVYIGIGVFTGGIELLVGYVITPRSAIFDLAFFIVMFSVLLWPRRVLAKTKLPSTSS
ncbi:MAG TPA: hypothetical protein VM535_00520 [Candidatus Saccharimonadales bacterium]|nr:hypothetical protein [Candidatus Saccharimonadales bacterium]